MSHQRPQFKCPWCSASAWNLCWDEQDRHHSRAWLECANCLACTPKAFVRPSAMESEWKEAVIKKATLGEPVLDESVRLLSIWLAEYDAVQRDLLSPHFEFGDAVCQHSQADETRRFLGKLEAKP